MKYDYSSVKACRLRIHRFVDYKYWMLIKDSFGLSCEKAVELIKDDLKGEYALRVGKEFYDVNLSDFEWKIITPEGIFSNEAGS